MFTIDTFNLGSPLGEKSGLGAAPGQVIRVKGLELDEFVEFVKMTAEALELNVALKTSAKRIDRFHWVTEGSPLFASSVLRLVSLG